MAEKWVTGRFRFGLREYGDSGSVLVLEVEEYDHQWRTATIEDLVLPGPVDIAPFLRHEKKRIDALVRHAFGPGIDIAVEDDDGCHT